MTERKHLAEGQPVPEVTFATRQDGVPGTLTSSELFAGRTVIVFALPGAFTPTCSSQHLPRYEELAGAFAQRGVDEIVCLSVNDPFVMEAWGRDQGAKRVRLVADGNGDFTEGMGMLVSKRDLGFGKRSWRYSMLVRDGIIEKLFVEPDVPGDPFEVSDADTMLRYLDPDADASAECPEITVFTRPGCPHCARAKALLEQRGLAFEEVEVGSDVSRSSLRAVAGTDTVPQVFIAGRHVGGADELTKYFEKGA
ncbi:MAG: glutathione peroxidase [Myxococcota bacterium]